MGDPSNLPPASADGVIERYPVDQQPAADGANQVVIPAGTPAPLVTPAVIPAAEGDRISGDDGRTAGRRMTGQLMDADPSNPTIGAYAKGTPVIRQGVPQPQGNHAVAVDRAVFENRYKGDPMLELTSVKSGTFWVPGSYQGWSELLQQALGDQLQGGELANASPATMKLLAEAIARLNGRSSLEALPEIVAIPNLVDLKAMLDSMDKRSRSADPPVIRPAVLEAQQAYNAGKPFPTYAMPREGSTYAPKWNDTLRGVVLHAYPHLFVTPNDGSRRPGAPPAQPPDAILKDLMLAVAAVNQLQSTDIGNAGVIWLPRLENAQEILKYLKDNVPAGDPNAPQTSRLDVVKQRLPELWRSIERTGNNAVIDLKWMQEMRSRISEGGMSRAEMRSELGNARRTLSVRSFETAWTFFSPLSMCDPFGMFPMAVAEWACMASVKPVEELPLRRADETFDAFVQRVEPDITPEEFRRTREDPRRFLMRRMNFLSDSGDPKPEAYGQFVRTTQELGLVDAEGNARIHTRQGETRRQSLDRAFMAAAEHSGLLDPLVAHLPEAERAKAKEAIIAGGVAGLSTTNWQTSLDPVQKDKLYALVGFMGFLEGETVHAGANARGDGRDICISMNKMLSREVKQAVVEYTPGKLDEYLRKYDPKIEAPPDPSWLERMIGSDGEQHKTERRPGGFVAVNDTANANSEAGIAQKRAQESAQRLTEQYVNDAKAAQVEASDAVAAVNQAEAKGEPVRSNKRPGGPGRRN